MKIQIILGSTRPGRKSELVCKWLTTKLPKSDDVTYEIIDLRDWPLPFFNEPVGPSQNGGKFTLALAEKWAAKIKEGDGYIFITPEYNHGYSAVLKNALDYVYYEWNQKPVAFVSYGGIAAGTRAVMQLTQIARELQMVSIREGVHLPFIWTAFDDLGNFKEEYHVPDPAPMIDQLIWWTKALKEAREKKPLGQQ